MKEKIWGILVHLSRNMWHSNHYTALTFDEEMWEYILKESVNTGINTIVLDVGDGVQFASHPEIAIDGAWSRKRVREEVKRCKDLGIALIPKLNFSTAHDFWLGEYARMVSTTKYYQVCNDLIKESYELFGHPEYIHLGFDEEDARNVSGHEYAVFRQKELFWHDLNFMLDCVADTGARPWIWSCPLLNHPEEYKKHVGAKDAVLSPWYYNAIREDHWTPVGDNPDYLAYFRQDIFKGLDIKFLEEDPFLVKFRKLALPLMEEGYDYIPCASVYNRMDWNTSDLVEYFRDNAPDEQILGYMTAPWCATLPTERSKKYFEESFRFLKEAKEKFYG